MFNLILATLSLFYKQPQVQLSLELRSFLTNLSLKIAYALLKLLISEGSVAKYIKCIWRIPNAFCSDNQLCFQTYWRLYVLHLYTQIQYVGRISLYAFNIYGGGALSRMALSRKDKIESINRITERVALIGWKIRTMAGHTKRPRRSRGASDISITTDTSVIEGKGLWL